jgi:hypothetical protein
MPAGQQHERVLACKTAPAADAMLGSSTPREADMERTDWLEKGYDPAEARFLMVTAITHHRFCSPLWGKEEVRKLDAELAELQIAAEQVTSAQRAAEPPSPGPVPADVTGMGFLSTWR